MSHKKINVGLKFDYDAYDYAYARNIVDVLDSANYRRVYTPADALSAALRLVRRATRARLGSSRNLENMFLEFKAVGADVFHFFNAVSFGRTPWVSTFETMLPRLSCTLQCHHGFKPEFGSLKSKLMVQRGIAAMASQSCKGILAMSVCAARIQEAALQHFPDHAETIRSKLEVLHPPQKLLVSSFASKKLNIDAELRIMFVGSSFFRKGGAELLEVLSELRTSVANKLRLVLVSSLRNDSYISQETPTKIERVKALITEGRDWIDWYPALPNGRVLELMKSCHIGVLPTYADTYGYSVLEFQAAGCPVISTNVRALPEINNNAIGWIIEVPKNALGEAIYTTQDARETLRRTISAGLSRCLREVVLQPGAISEKADRAIARIRHAHAPDAYRARLAEIYTAATSG